MEIYGILSRTNRPDLIYRPIRNGWMILSYEECKELLYNAGIHSQILPIQCPSSDLRRFIPLGTSVVVTTNIETVISVHTCYLSVDICNLLHVLDSSSDSSSSSYSSLCIILYICLLTNALRVRHLLLTLLLLLFKIIRSSKTNLVL